ncbi:MAG: pilus assembly protein PilM [Candidatus Omnitrophica bacterium]|nr:pilus assembly protein PilM [Candidatus Omnitrophota bacterium]
MLKKIKSINLLRLKDKFLKEKLSVGLDIGASTIKLIKLEFLKEKPQLSFFSLEPVGNDLKAALKKIIDSQGIKAVNISVSGPSTIIRYVNFPKMNNDELSQALKFEAQKHIPFSSEEVNIDSYILKHNLPDNKMLVLLTAVKKESLNQRLKLIEEAGLNTNVVDIDSIALINAFNFSYSQDDNLKTKASALLNIGASLSNLNILEGGIPRLSRDIHIGGNNFTQKIQDLLSIDFKSAEELKLNPDKERLDKVLPAIEAILSNLAQEIRASFDYYESQSASSVIKIFLSGGGSLFTGLKDILANLLGIEVEYWDPLRAINISEGVDPQKIKASSHQLAVAIGLALHS